MIDYTTRNLRRYAATVFRENELNITMEQWAILNITKDHGGVSHLTLLSKMMAKDAPTLTKMIDLLCKKGYLERQLNQEDRRKWNLVITKDGLAKELEAFILVRTIREKIIDGLSDKEIKSLKNILLKINNTIEA